MCTFYTVYIPFVNETSERVQQGKNAEIKCIFKLMVQMLSVHVHHITSLDCLSARTLSIVLYIVLQFDFCLKAHIFEGFHLT